MRIRDIETFFEVNVAKKTLSELSFDDANSRTLIVSDKDSFNFDEINKKLKTSDTIFFENDSIIFVEFKSGNIPAKDLRLKAIESITSFYNYVHSKGFTEIMAFPSEIFKIYFVYDYKSKPSQLNYFSQIEKELRFEYRHLFSTFKLIDNNRFKKLFRIQ